MFASHPVTRRRFLGAVGFGAALGLLTACGGAATGTVSNTGTTTASSAATVAATQSAATTGQAAGAATPVPSALIAGSKATVTVAYWDWASVWQPLLKKLAQTYVTAQPQYTVNVQIQPDYYTKLQVAFAGGAGPDAYRTDSPTAFSLAYRNVLVDLSSYLDKDATAKGSFGGMAVPSQQAATYQGKVVGMPFGGTLEMTIFNQDLVQAAQLTPPSDLGAKWDWNAATDYGKKLTKGGNGPRPSVYGFWSNPSWEEGWLNFVLANGGQFLDPAKGFRECLIGQPAAVEAIQYMVDLILKDGVSPTSQDLSSESGTSLFLTGKVAITTLGSWEIPQIRQAKINFNIAPVPYSPKTGKTGSNSNFSLIGVNPASKVKDDAAAYALWQGTAPAQEIIGTFEFMPASVAAAEKTYFQPSLGPANRSVLADILKITSPQPSTDVVSTNDMFNIADQEMPLIFQGKEAVADGLTKVAQQVNAKIQQAVKAG